MYYLQSRYYDPEIGRFINADAFTSTGQGILGNNMFAYCNNNPVNLSDNNGTIPFADDPFAEAYQKFGEWLSPYARKFFSKLFKSLAGSCSVSGEVGYGFGAKGKVGTVSVDTSVIIVADEWSATSDGTTEAIRKAAITVQGKITENLSIGADVQYDVPLAAGKKYGLLDAPDGKFSAVVGAYAFNHGIGWNTTPPQDIEFSCGLSGYLILGGGFEFSINLNRFVQIWCE